MKQVKGLDTLRAFAVFFVLIQHTGVWFDTTVFNGKLIYEVLIPDGGSGVFIFFVLSGFLITSILLNSRKNSEDKNRLHLAKNFFIRRALRIFPIYYLCVFILYAFNFQEFRLGFFYHLTYTTNIFCYRTNAWHTFSHAWTLSVEEQFYLFWPWFILFVNQNYLKYVFYIAIATGIISTWYCMSLTGHMAPLLVCNCFDAFGIGGLYAYARLNDERCRKFEKTMKIAGWVSLCIYLYWKLSFFTGHNDVYGLFLVKTVNSVLAICLIIAIMNNKSELVRKYLLENRFFNFIGKISYGMYLYHGIYFVWWCSYVSDFLEILTKNSPSLHLIVNDHHYFYWLHHSVVVLISWLSYKIIEQPLLRLKRYFEYDKRSEVQV